MVRGVVLLVKVRVADLLALSRRLAMVAEHTTLRRGSEYEAPSIGRR